MQFQFRHHNRAKYPQKHVLICEDDLTQQKRILEHLAEVFEPQGIVQFSVVPSSLMAAAIVKSISVDLIILDHDLPQGNGSDLLKWLKQEKYQIPVITFSGISTNNINMMNLGADHLYSKEEVICGKADRLIKKILKMNKGVAEYYVNTVSPANPNIPRYWATDNILIGGNILSAEDWQHIKSTYDITAVINADGHTDVTFGVDNLLEVYVLDNGDPFPEDKILESIAFANKFKDQSIYIHCHMGMSRSPHFAYAILRGCYEKSEEEAINIIKSSLPDTHHWGFNQHTSKYIASVETALKKWRSN